ncbi:MAG TPA: 1-(5-phosphoribosyl)-5-amino-4-imidazole-carboxylate carboxylase, partial [Bacteroidales bacterium]|nr:1-(5-phosphoribosyl)-5-amino-4-imidazole-carboxylate carboxylase [Bacteroidales bacterium]
MTGKEIEKLLYDVKKGSVSVEDAFDRLRSFPYTDLGFARIDHHREIRTGYPEIVYCAGKTTEQVRGIFGVMIKKENNV